MQIGETLHTIGRDRHPSESAWKHWGETLENTQSRIREEYLANPNDAQPGEDPVNIPVEP